MSGMKEKIVNWFDSILIGLLIKRFGLPEANEMPPSVCPEPEMLAAYVEANLSPQMVREIEGHVRSCRRCSKTVISVLNSQTGLSNLGFSTGKEAKI